MAESRDKKKAKKKKSPEKWWLWVVAGSGFRRWLAADSSKVDGGVFRFCGVLE
jgi:hypothetical protein